MIRLLLFINRCKVRGRAKLINFLANIFQSLHRFPLQVANKRIFVDLRDKAAIQLFLDNNLPHEVGLQKLLVNIIRDSKDICFYDIGANIGYYTLLFSESSNIKEIYSFEPSPVLSQNLRESLKDNSKVKILNLGLSDIVSEKEFFLNKDSSNLSSFIKLTKASALKVKVDTLDHLISSGKINPPDLIKMDVEGYEFNVLKGFSLINEYNPIIIMEYAENFAIKMKYNLNSISEYLGDSWRIHRINNLGYLNNNLVLNEDSSNDYLLIKKDHKYFNTLIENLVYAG